MASTDLQLGWPLLASSLLALLVASGLAMRRNGEQLPGGRADRRAHHPRATGATESTADSPARSFEGVAFFPGRRRDEIPAVDYPVFAATASPGAALGDEDWVVGVVRGGVARTYPLWILARCEIVNDRIEGHPLAVTYCPISGSAVVFDAVSANGPLEFGNEGSLYEANLLMYDRATGSIWNQLRGRALTGPRQGETLARVPASLGRWREWRRQQPNAALLVADARGGRFFRVQEESSWDHPPPEAPTAPVSRSDARLARLQPVLGFAESGGTGCLPLEAVRALPPGRHALVDAPHWSVVVDPTQDLRLEDPHGRNVPWIPAYWFTWYAAYPTGQVHAVRAAPAPSP